MTRNGLFQKISNQNTIPIYVIEHFCIDTEFLFGLLEKLPKR
jgi:hypothetical protein